MTKKEALQILAILKAAYPNSYRGMSAEEAAGTVSVWAIQFANIPADIVLMAVQKVISTSKYPPSINEVKTKLTSIHWEAYDVVSSSLAIDAYPEEIVAQMRRIYEATKDYKLECGIEPGLLQMLPENRAALEGGKLLT